jgi:exodeoxyribonuclease III
MSCSIATWNVNSLRARIEPVCDWLAQNPVDVLAIQETKTPDETFPLEPLQNLGYHVSFSGQKAYNGVALVSKAPLSNVLTALPHWPDPEKRFLAATTSDNICIVNVYVPNGRALDSEKFAYKLEWLHQLSEWLTTACEQHDQLIVLGDFNIAPTDLDVYDPALWQNRLLVSPAERKALQTIESIGLTDLFRHQCPTEPGFSWWDYRSGAFRQNHGLRIDLLLATATLAACCTSVQVDTAPRAWPKPSDHTPVWATFCLEKA